MKRLLLVYMFLWIRPVTGQSQNFVPNGDFETYTTCPFSESQIQFAPPWDRPTDGTSDYFNACCPVSDYLNVPHNEFGDQAAHSGNGYAGFYTFYNTIAPPPVNDGVREYIQAPLTQPLAIGKIYKVEFYLSLAEFARYAVTDIGCLFSIDPPAGTDYYALNRTPQITSVTGVFLSDKTNWMKVTGCFEADSAYRYITIGNFNDGMHTSIQHVGSPTPVYFSYYYIDDVSVTETNPPQLGNDTTICKNNMLLLDAGAGGDAYLWSSGETTQQIQVQTNGNWWVEKIVGDCHYLDSIQVAVFSPPDFSLGPDTSLLFCRGASLLLDRSDLHANQYLWSTGETTSSISIHVEGIYKLKAVFDFGCQSSDEIKVIESCPPSFYIPNSFTPNSDGINDFLFMFGENIEKFEIKIFNRWGQLVFISDNLHDSWDGTYQGSKCTTGLYVYAAVYKKDVETITRSGTISLIR